MNYFQGLQPHPTLTLPQVGPGALPPTLDALSRFVADGLIRPVMEGLREAATNFTDTVGGMSRARPGMRYRPRTDRECCDEPDPCHCYCCIVDADLVIYARLGERRIVPLTIENRWRRERKVRVELSGWSTRGGSPANVNARLQPLGPEFTLPPCGQQALVLIVEAMPAGGSDNEQRIPDVDDCVVYYADLRVEGCEIRPIRIALALLPRDCGDYRIDCRCQCC